MAMVSRFSLLMKTNISSLKLLGGNKKYPEELKGWIDSMQAAPQRGGSTMKGGHQKKLVTEEEFYKCFANPYAYGTNADKWSAKNILLYKYNSNATTKYQVIPEDTWKRFDNKPREEDYEGKHAELFMIEDLRKIQNYYEEHYKAILSLEVILGYSPCADCSQRLCSEKEKMDELLKQSKKRNKCSNSVHENMFSVSSTTEVDEEKIKMKITFANFYMYNDISNKNGLANLWRKDIKLDVFTDDNWKYFFKAAGLVTRRQIREADDKKILQELKEFAALTPHSWEEQYQIE